MIASLLATKLHVPPRRTNVVQRSHLIARLNDGLQRKLTLICAPAGFGKTTLVSAWLMECARPVAWLSLDEADSDPTRFMHYLIAALQTIAPTVGIDAIAMLQSAQPASHEAMLTSLINDLVALNNEVVLVLDDYQLIEHDIVERAISFLIEHMPPQLHLVIISRAEPQVPLARWRVRNQLNELRAADLRFNDNEAAAFLNHVMGLNLTTDAVATLEQRTEGWIAGLQLAALSMQGRADLEQCVKAFAGNHRYIQDYLIEEMLDHQPQHVRDFLLRTSILERLNGSLCDAVTEQTGSQAQLAALEHKNFLIVPLDDTRQWYRYHHLFADVLRDQLKANQPETIANLHQRASIWYEQHGWLSDAIHHALQAENVAHAADLIERAAPAMRQSRQDATLLSWFKTLPDDVFHARPVLSINAVGAYLAHGDLAGAELRLHDAERWHDTAMQFRERSADLPAHMIVVDDQTLRRLPESIALYRAALMLAHGDITQTMIFAQQALDLVADDDHLICGAATALLGLSHWTSGDLNAACYAYSNGMMRLQRAGHIADAIGGVTALADIYITQGRLHEAMHTYERGLQLAIEHGMPSLRGTADMYVGMSEIMRERNDLAAAEHMIARSQAQGEHIGFPRHPYRWRVALAHLRMAQGNVDDALRLMNEAERVYVSDFFPDVQPIAAIKARAWIALGRLDATLNWVRDHKVSVQDQLSFMREFEHITLARLLLAQASITHDDQALNDLRNFLERLLDAATAGERTGSVIEILLLQSLAHQLYGDISAALQSLAHALKLAEPEGYVRVFVDEGQPLVTVLQTASTHGIAPNYVSQLLNAFGVTTQKPHVPQSLIEPLSEREHAVLRLLKTDLSGPEIAQELVISLNTLRTHTKNIYAKLGVNSRRAAVRQAQELDLF